MPSFSYIARTSEGTLEKGKISAPSAESAREKLRKQQLLVEELQQENESVPTMGFTGAMPWTTTDDDLSSTIPAASTAKKSSTADTAYLPLVDTLRLFAGWLLAWYGMVYVLGSYQLAGKISEDIPFLQALFESPLVLRFSFGTFLFLLLTSVHRWLGRGMGKGIALALAGLILFLLFNANA